MTALDPATWTAEDRASYLTMMRAYWNGSAAPASLNDAFVCPCCGHRDESPSFHPLRPYDAHPAHMFIVYTCPRCLAGTRYCQPIEVTP